MIIRSQDKKNILNIANVTGISILKTRNEDFKIIACFPYSLMDDRGYSRIGTYSTEEKAIKVLDMIIEHYDKVMDARYWNDTYQDNYFQMPQDSEV